MQNETHTLAGFSVSMSIDLAEFTPKYYEEILVYKSNLVKTGTLSGYRSAIDDLYRVNRVALPPEYGDGRKQLFSSMKRIEADRDQTAYPRTS